MISGIVLLVLSVVLGIGGIVAGIAPLLGERPARVEGSVALDLEAGQELAVYRVDGGGEGSCGVTAPDGTGIPLTGILGEETLTLDGTRYDVAATGTAVVDGTHEVRCTSTGFAVGPRLGVLRLVGTVLGAVFGAMGMGVVGIVLLVIGLSRRKAARRAGAAVAPGPGSGWQGGPPPG